VPDDEADKKEEEMKEGGDEPMIEEVTDKIEDVTDKIGGVVKKNKRIQEKKVLNEEMKKKPQTAKFEDCQKKYPPAPSAHFDGGVSGWEETHKVNLVEISRSMDIKWDPGPRIYKKVSGVLYTCSRTRGVYLDIAMDYFIEAVIHMVRRLMVYEGNVGLKILDPGSQLKRTDEEISGWSKGWDQDIKKISNIVNKRAESDTLTDDWNFLPTRTIKDLEAKNPPDWVDNAKMVDPEDFKPEDWDDEMHGEWEPPDYEGIAKYEEDCKIGFDMCQVKSRTVYDDMMITDDPAAAKTDQEELWAVTKDIEKKLKDAKDEEERAKTEVEADKDEDEKDRVEEEEGTSEKIEEPEDLTNELMKKLRKMKPRISIDRPTRKLKMDPNLKRKLKPLFRKVMQDLPIMPHFGGVCKTTGLVNTTSSLNLGSRLNFPGKN